ncbi:MAG: IS3 family transposase [Bdellovibrionales bacterium]|nr:IS3 family transposase [Bdellovibrionales bacterium]
MGVAEKGSKSRLAQELGVSRSSLYYQRKMPAKDEALRREIEAVMEENPGYGSPRVAIALGINEKRAARVMRKFGLKPARRCKSPRKRGDEGREPLKYPNILARLSPAVPDMVWASDFTFISYRNEFIFLCTVMDVFTGEVLGFNISRNHDARFVRLAIERAIQSAGCLPEWFHSDQGSEYASETVCTWLEGMGVQISMNPKGSPWCNGSQESFFGRFKVEFGDFDRFDSLAELLEELYDQIYYFTFRRIKNKLKMSPAQFREKWLNERKELLTVLNIYQHVTSLPPDPPPGTPCRTSPLLLFE